MRLARTPRWITFDCYGTLIDTRAGYTRVWRELLADKGAPADDATVTDVVRAWGEQEFRLVRGPYRPYREILVESVAATLRARGLAVADGDGQRLAAAWGTFEPYRDVEPALRRLGKHHRLAIISNADNDLIRESVRRIGVAFDAVFTAEDCRSYKPGHRPFEHALRGMGVSAPDVLHVAFGYQYDHGTASAMGFMTVWVNRRQLTLPADVRTFDLEIPDLSSLPDLLAP